MQGLMHCMLNKNGFEQSFCASLIICDLTHIVCPICLNLSYEIGEFVEYRKKTNEGQTHAFKKHKILTL